MTWHGCLASVCVLSSVGAPAGLRALHSGGQAAGLLPVGFAHDEGVKHRVPLLIVQAWSSGVALSPASVLWSIK